MKKETNKKKEIIAAALRGDRAEFDRLTRAKLTFFKVDEQHFKGNLETPITEAEFKNLFQPGYDSIFEMNRNPPALRETLTRFGYSEEEIERKLKEHQTAPERLASNINELIQKLESE